MTHPIIQSIFWGSAFLVGYTYFFYPIVLFGLYSARQILRDFRYLLFRQDGRAQQRDFDLPGISLVIAAYNEERHLPAKIENLQTLDYPQDKLEVIFVSDGSTDRTNEILNDAASPKIRSIILAERKGKPNALNHGVAEARHEVLVLSDAATLFDVDALKTMVRHFSDPKVGVVCGSLRFIGTAESNETEGVYWRYESALRLMEARIGATLTASGAMYALRKACYTQLGAMTMIEELIVPMHARKLGFAVLCDPEAKGTEFAASTVGGEFARRVRIAVGSFRALNELARIPLDGYTCFAFVSHKLLRWMVPFFLIGMMASNLLLWNTARYGLLLGVQAVFYLWAAAGYLLRNSATRVRFALLGYFLVAMNLAFLVGFFRFLFGDYKSTWQRVS